MQFVDKALARRLEAAEEVPQVLYARLFQKTRPEIGAAEEAICGGHMVFAGLGSPIGRATAVGLDEPLTSGNLDRIEDFYRSHNAPAQVDASPLHDAAVFEMFKQRGYAIAELNNVLYCPLQDVSNERTREEVEEKVDGKSKFSPFAPAGFQIRPGRFEEAEVASSLMERCFFPEGPPPEFRGLLTPLYQMEGALVFVATAKRGPEEPDFQGDEFPQDAGLRRDSGLKQQDQIVACGAGLVIPEHRIFALFGAGTLPEFRGKGLQTALLQHRMAAAAKAGCEYAVIVTQAGTTSQRNAERLGFRVAYSKVTVIKSCEPTIETNAT